MASASPAVAQNSHIAAATKSPDSDVSPRTRDPASSPSVDYFSEDVNNSSTGTPSVPVPAKINVLKPDSPSPLEGASTVPSITSLSLASNDIPDDSRRISQSGSDRPATGSRKSSVASVSFRQPRNPSLPQGLPRKTDNRRLRESSPSPIRFRPHVGFDNLPVGEATKNNTSSFTLHVRHQGYQPSRRSRTFMVGVDEHAYSDYALVWLLNNMVDDGDEVVCVRVIESPIRPGEKNYQDDAKKLLYAIQAKNELNKAISIILEYSVGKLHATFQQLLHIYQPSMLIVGTKGRSLGGIQGLMNTRNSFSKYCLQYSPVPVVVVRPDDKRLRKKEKRTQDPGRQSYVAMLAHNDGKHEADSEASSVYELERGISADEEAHRVAAAIGLPAAFDPTIKPYEGRHPTVRRPSPSSLPSSPPTATGSTSSGAPTTAPDSGDDDSGDDDDEFEVEAVSGQHMAKGRELTAQEREQKKRLHAMEVGEAAALLKSKEAEEDDDDDDTKCAPGSQGGDGDSCAAAPPPGQITTLGTIVSLSPFLVTFLVVSVIVTTRIFPHLSRIQQSSRSGRHDGTGGGSIDDGEDHILPASAPLSLRQAHAAHASSTPSAKRKERIASWTFAITLGLTAVLGELILAEISGLVSAHARGVALGFTVPTLVGLLVVIIPFLEIWSVVGGLLSRGGSGKGKGKIPTRLVWLVQFVVFGIWLSVFWYVGRAVPPAGVDERDYYLYAHGSAAGEGIAARGEGKEPEGGFDSTAMTIGRAESRQESVGDVVLGGGSLSRACLERIGVIGILLMALLSGFASVSSPWHMFSDSKAYKRRPITDADIVRKQTGLDATNELLLTKKHRLKSLQRKVAVLAEAGGVGPDGKASSGGGLVGKVLGSLKEIAGGGDRDAAEIKSLQLEISGLETMEANLASSLASLRKRKAEHARDGTVLGKVLAIPGFLFSIYCIYRILATALTTLRRMYYPTASFSSSDPINRFLGLLAKHWDPKLDQIAWARQISFLLSGVILAASANSVLQTFQLFAKWAPGLLYQAKANLALLLGQIAATYVISAALLMRSNLPREVGRSVGDALESALEPGFVDRWFEGWFLIASCVTGVGIWVGRKMLGPGTGGGAGGGGWDDLYWDDLGGEEEMLGAKRS
ncbi:Abscisic acid G-protein coupled receptor domain containing protein [Naviculisporaceae sp. PSN 640]